MWIPSKLTRPGRFHNAIYRPRVLELLEQACCQKLVLFRSPAGYGKTTMAAQWLADKPNVAWFNIDENDNDSYRFINYLLQTINKATNFSCSNTLQLAETRQSFSIHSLLSEMFSELSAFTQECFIVLDDYHLITNDEIHDAVRFLLKHMPENITLVVTSRSAPPLGTANLRVRDLMIEIDSDMLAFDVEETARFFDQRMAEAIDEETVNNLRLQVEGWPSALQLIALQAKHQNITLAQTNETLSNLNMTHLWDYLAEEVFDILEPDTRRFLMQLSVLDHFNDQLVFELTQREDALGMIESLNRYGLFIYPLEGENNWFRFHNLFKEFLSHERHSKLMLHEQELHLNAAQAWLKLESPHQALCHARKAQSDQLMVEILDKFGWDMNNHGEFAIVEGAINQLSPDVLFTQPKLTLMRAWLAQIQHRSNEVRMLLEEAEQEYKKRNIELDIQYHGQANTLLAQVAINSNQPEMALELAELALSQLETTNYNSRIIATSIVGEVNHVLGKLDQALTMMQQTEKLARQYQVYHQALWAIAQQSEIMAAQGYVQAAYDVQESGFRLIEEHNLQQFPLHEFLLRIRSQILWSWNRLDEAEECAYKGLKVLGNQSPSELLNVYSMLARVAISRGTVDKATKHIKHIQHLMEQSNYHVDWVANASLSLILYWQERGDTEAMQDWLESAVRPVSASNHFFQLQWRNIARVYINLEQYDDARKVLDFLAEEAKKSQLIADTNRNLIVEAIWAYRQNQDELAKARLKEALTLSNQTGMVCNYLINGADVGHIFEKISMRSELDDLERHRAQQLLKDISLSQHSRSGHFDEEFVERLIDHPNVPELVRTSPLTQREWQVLGLIYSGFGNEKIAHKLDVASTTVKTHIRNLYQKLNITNRREAIETAEKLLQLVNR